MARTSPSPDLARLIAEREALDKRIDAARRAARSGAIAQVRALMAEYGLTVEDLGALPAAAPGSPPRKARKAAKASGQKLPPKFRDPQTGQTWSGRGLKPRWLQAALAEGRRIEDFRI